MSVPVSAATAVIWHNGQLVREDEVVISPFDHGLLTGDGVFETMIAYEPTPFAFSRHYRRLERSAQVFGLNLPALEVLRKASEEVIKANGLNPSRLRITVTGGHAPLGSEKGESAETVLVAAMAPPNHPPVGDVITVPYPRNEHGATVGLKTISYGENVIALAAAHAAGVKEAIFGNCAGNLCEGTGSNIFIVRDGQLITPPLSAGCLPGVTRALVLELCGKLGIDVKEIDTPLAELKSADSAFITSTLRDVQPIAHVDGVALKEVETELSKRLSAAFKALVAEQVDP
jgi:branched-chain amino acid aminotransferase